ncbi:MAG: hypothetical protein KGM24_00085 [Elusimicrobia bacterium]|nr:hypothetical protein [Elusimicrobiota bacterium]
MNARAAPLFGAVLSLALVRAGPSHALSLRNSAAEILLGDASPGTKAGDPRARSARLRVENSGRDPARVEFGAVVPPRGGLKDGYEPWPYPDKVRLLPTSAELAPGKSGETELVARIPKRLSRDPGGGQYQFDVLARGRDPAGASLTLTTKVLLSVGPPLARAGDSPAGGYAPMPGFQLSPPSAEIGPVPWDARGSDPGGGTTLKLINAGDRDATVVLTPARDWDDSAQPGEGYPPAPNPRWLKVDPPVVKVRAGAIGSARIRVAVPKEKRYAGRRWAFVVAVTASSGGHETRRWFVLNVRTSDWEEDGRAR